MNLRARVDQGNSAGGCGLVVGRGSYGQAQHLDGSVMGHRWRCNVDNEAKYTRLQAWLARGQSPERVHVFEDASWPVRAAAEPAL